MASPEAEAPPSKRRSPRIDADKKCRTAAKQLASAVTERVWGLAVAPDGKEYYYHLNTNATAWSLPAGAILQADGDTYVSEEQHRLSPRISPKAKASPSTRSPKGGSPKARVAAATGSPKSPNSRVDTAAATPPGKALATGAAAHAAGLLAKEVHRLRPLLQESRADLLALKAEQDRSVVTLQAALLGILSRAPEAQKLPDVPTELHVEADAAGEPQDAAEEEAVEEEETAAEEEEAVEEAEEEEAMEEAVEEAVGAGVGRARPPSAGSVRAAEAVPITSPLRSTKYCTAAEGAGESERSRAPRVASQRPPLSMESNRRQRPTTRCTRRRTASEARPSLLPAAFVARGVSVQAPCVRRSRAERSQSKEPLPVARMTSEGSVRGSQSCRLPTKPTQQVSCG